MRKILFTFLFLSSSLSAQDITLSSDSILAYNNFLSSIAGQVQLVSHSSSSIRLDSGFVKIDDIDTVGIAHFIAQNMLETYWKGDNTNNSQFTWSMDKISANLYRLHKKEFTPSDIEPLSFSAGTNTAEIFHLQIGYCFQCALFPKYPRYIRGSLILYFSNGQIVNLHIYSNDLRTTIKKSPIRITQPDERAKKNDFIVNGQRLPKGIGSKSNNKKIHIIAKKELW